MHVHGDTNLFPNLWDVPVPRVTAASASASASASVLVLALALALAFSLARAFDAFAWCVAWSRVLRPPNHALLPCRHDMTWDDTSSVSRLEPRRVRVCRDEVLTTQDHGRCRCIDSNTCDWNMSVCIVMSWLPQQRIWYVDSHTNSKISF